MSSFSRNSMIKIKWLYLLRVIILSLLLPFFSISCAGLKIPFKEQSEGIIIIEIVMTTPGLWKMPAEVTLKDISDNEIISGKFAGFQGLTIFTNIKQGRFAIQSISGSTLEYSPEKIKTIANARPEPSQTRYHILDFPEDAAKFDINRKGLYYLGKFHASVRESYSTSNETHYNLVNFERATAVEEREGLEVIKSAVLNNSSWTEDDIIYSRKR